MPEKRLRYVLAAIVAAGTIIAASSMGAVASPILTRHGANVRPVTAATVTRSAPRASNGCSADACITLGTPYKSNGKWYVLVHGCAWHTGLFGHIHLSGPHGVSTNSLAKTWSHTLNYCTGSDDAYAPAIKSPPVGKYCATVYSGKVNEGRACESLHKYRG